MNQGCDRYPRDERIAALLAALLAGFVFFFCLAPGVTLGDSGELVTAAYTFGVPHPPGYPLWTLLGFLWSHCIMVFGNPAWRVGVLSVVTGAALVGVLALTMIRVIRLLLASLPWSVFVPERQRHLIALTIGVSAALLFGFNRGVWHWACVAEMHALDIFMVVLMAYAFLAWISPPRQGRYLYAVAFLLGASFHVYRTTAPMMVSFLLSIVVIRALQCQRTVAEGGRFRDFMKNSAIVWEVGVAVLLSYGCVKILLWRLIIPTASVWNYHDWDYPGWALGGSALALGLLAVGWCTGWWRPWRALACAGCFLAGLALYLYVPLAASTNPPMNWGYAATRTGFIHMMHIGSYQRMIPSNFFTPDFGSGLACVAQSLAQQYSLPLSLFSLVSLPVMIFGWKRTTLFGRGVLIFLWLAMLANTLDCAIEVQNRSMAAAYLDGILVRCSAPAHLFATLLIGTGVAMCLSLVAMLRLKGVQTAVRWISVGLLVLPLVVFTRNWPACNQHRNDFGYLFGYRMFAPGGTYPPMEKNAVLFAGTDDGRFISTYMVFCESRMAPRNQFHGKPFDRSDVSVLSQNAFADTTYMSYIRDQYGFERRNSATVIQQFLGRDHTYPPEPIHIPKAEDSNKAFQQFSEDVQAGLIPSGPYIKLNNGRINALGVSGVMCINGILAHWIFDSNKNKHSFYVEESYVIPWMYPLLRPAGIIMKLETQPLPSPQENPQLWREIVARDRVYWNQLASELLARVDFRRNDDAQQCFSKLRVAIAGVYAFQGMNADAEYAFQQALQLYPQSSETRFRLADFYLGQRRYEEARTLMEALQKLEPGNVRAREFTTMIIASAKDDIRRQELEEQPGGQGGALNVDLTLELAAIYQRQGLDAEFEKLARSMMAVTNNLPPRAYPVLATLCRDARQWGIQENALRYCLQDNSNDFKLWVDLAFAELAQNKHEEALVAFGRAVEIGNDAARKLFQYDGRTVRLKSDARFQALVAAPH